MGKTYKKYPSDREGKIELMKKERRKSNKYKNKYYDNDEDR